MPKHPNLAPTPTSVPSPLGLREAGALAVTRAPALAAARAQVEVAAAKAYDAGLLPDPTLGLSLAHPIYGGTAADHNNAWSANLTESLIGIITTGEKHKAASAHYAEKLLSWRWHTRQVALKAETVWLTAWASGREVAALRRESKAAQELAAAARRAHAAGALAPVMYRQALAQVASLRLRVQAAADRKVQAETTLATLLRVQAGRDWKFAPPATFGAPAPSLVATALARLPERRLDLLALQAGYRSANADLRAAILAQFPILDIGFTRASDNTRVNTVGFGLTLRLPLFNGNRGKIAIARATRKSLNAAYQAHLDSAVNQARAVYARLRLAQREYAALKPKLPELKRSAKAAQKALANGNVTRFTAWTALSAWLDARVNADQLRAQIAQLALTLHVLLALPPPAGATHAGVTT